VQRLLYRISRWEDLPQEVKRLVMKKAKERRKKNQQQRNQKQSQRLNHVQNCVGRPTCEILISGAAMLTKPDAGMGIIIAQRATMIFRCVSGVITHVG
jgi:hypothetical protein